LLVGPAGGGKTTAARIAAEANGMAYTERSMGPATSQWDLLGFQSPTTGAYVPGIMKGPYVNGGMLALDELDNSNPSVPTAFNSALANGHFTFPDNIESVRHGDFVCVAMANTYGRGADRVYVGRQQLDGATLDRFIVMDWDYDESLEVAWSGGDTIARDWVAFVQRIRARAFDLKERIVVSPRASIYGARLLRAGMPRERVENLTLWKGATADLRAKLGGR
jgi:MoxR-like ATPase